MIDYKRLVNEMIDEMIKIHGTDFVIEMLLDYHISKEQLIEDFGFVISNLSEVE